MINRSPSTPDLFDLDISRDLEENLSVFKESRHLLLRRTNTRMLPSSHHRPRIPRPEVPGSERYGVDGRVSKLVLGVHQT